MKKKTTKKFNWLTRLNRLAKAKTRHFRPKDFGVLTRKAGEWPTCACGQLCKALPVRNSMPLDETLRRAGMQFTRAVERRRWQTALRIFRKIEARTTLLLKQMAQTEKQAAGAGGRI